MDSELIASCNLARPGYDMHCLHRLYITITIDEQYPILINRALGRRSRLEDLSSVTTFKYLPSSVLWAHPPSPPSAG
jgi:hypothetical protein